MPARPMQFCKRGHDTFIGGRTKWGACQICYSNRRVDGTGLRASRLREGFCFRGHDTKITGRNKSRECLLCRAETNRKHAWKGYLNESGGQFGTPDYDRLYQIQGGKCAICGRHQSATGKTLEVDHDHDTMLVRGLLCSGCNMHLGKYEQMKPAADRYLKKAENRNPTGTPAIGNECCDAKATKALAGNDVSSTEEIPNKEGTLIWPQ